MTLLALSAASWIGLSVIVALVFGVVIRTVDRHEAAVRAQRPAAVPEAPELNVRLVSVTSDTAAPAAEPPVLPSQPSRAARLTVVA